MQKNNGFIARMGTTHHNKGHMSVFKTSVHIYIYFLLGVNCERSQWFEVGGGVQIEKTRGISMQNHFASSNKLSVRIRLHTSFMFSILEYGCAKY